MIKLKRAVVRFDLGLGRGCAGWGLLESDRMVTLRCCVRRERDADLRWCGVRLCRSGGSAGRVSRCQTRSVLLSIDKSQRHKAPADSAGVARWIVVVHVSNHGFTPKNVSFARAVRSRHPQPHIAWAAIPSQTARHPTRPLCSTLVRRIVLANCVISCTVHVREACCRHTLRTQPLHAACNGQTREVVSFRGVARQLKVQPNTVAAQAQDNLYGRQEWTPTPTPSHSDRIWLLRARRGGRDGCRRAESVRAWVWFGQNSENDLNPSKRRRALVYTTQSS